MKENTFYTWIMAGLLVLGATSVSHAHGDKKHGQVSPAALDSLFASYLDIQQALAKDDAAGARKASEAFLNKPVELPQELSHNVEAMDILKGLRAINAAENLPSIRAAFLGLSEHMILLLSETGHESKDTALVFFCPMTNEKKGGRWLQDTRKIANPYYGKSMPTCGSLKTQLSPPLKKKTGNENSSGTSQPR